jgi:sortase A
VTPFSTPPAPGDEPVTPAPSGAFSQPPTGDEERPFTAVSGLEAPAFTTPPRRRFRLPTRAAASAMLIVFSCFVLGYSIWETQVSGWFAAREQEQLRTEFAALADEVPATVPRTTSAPAPVAPRQTTTTTTTLPAPAAMPATGELVGRITIPAIDLDWMVIVGTDAKELKRGPGLWRYGVVPGMPGNATVAGHRTTYGGPFRRLGDLQPGDRITVEVPGRPKAVFEVRGSGRVAPKDVYVTTQVPGVRLTLLTCDPPGSTARRLVVQAELVEGEYASRALAADVWRFVGEK